MRINKFIGMRTIKTGLAVTLCCLFTKFAVDNMFYCATACVVTMQDTIKTSYKMGFQRVFGTMIGGLVGFILVLILPANPFLCGFGIIVVIKCCEIFKLSSLVVSSVTFFSLYLGYIDSAPIAYSIQRVMDTSVGVIMGLIINYTVARPNYYHHTIKQFDNVKDLFNKDIQSIVMNKNELRVDEIEENINKIEAIYSKLIDELDYSNRDFDLDIIDEGLDLSRQIYFHIKSIELLEKKLYISKENNKKIKKMLKNQEIKLQINEKESPVFNFHLSKIVDKMNELNQLVDIDK